MQTSTQHHKVKMTRILVLDLRKNASNLSFNVRLCYTSLEWQRSHKLMSVDATIALCGSELKDAT